jgi:hypothetical protein
MSDFDSSGATPHAGQPHADPYGAGHPPAHADPYGAAPPLGPGGWPVSRGPAPVNGRDLLVGLAVVLVVAALGAPLAFLWSLLGPHATVVMTDGGPLLDDYNTEAFVGGDATFGAIAVGAGILTGLGVWLLRRWRGPVLLVGLALGGIASAWVTWKLGHQIGLSDYEGLLRDAEVGEKFTQPMKLRAQGLLFLQATIAVIVYVVNAAWSHRADLGTGRAPEPLTYSDVPVHATVSSAPSAPAGPPAAPAPPAGGSAWSPPA